MRGMRNKAASLALAAGISVGSLSGCSAINEKLSGAPGDVKLEHVVDAKISDTQYESIDAAARNAAMVVLKKSVEQEGNAPRRMFSFAEQTGQIELHNTQGILDIGTDDSGEPIVELQIGNTENGITSSRFVRSTMLNISFSTDLSEKEAGRPVSVRRMTEIVEDPATQVSEVIWTDNGSNPDGIKQLGYYITKVGFGSIHSWSVVNEDIGDEYGISVSPLDSSSEAERSKELSDMVLNQIETTAPLR